MAWFNPWTSRGALALLVAIPLSAQAQRTPTAPLLADEDVCRYESVCRELTDQATASYQAGDYSAALLSYQSAYSRYALPMLLYNIARTHHRLGQLNEAEQSYTNFIAQSNNAEVRRKAQDYLGQIEQARAAQQRAPEVKPIVPPVPVQIQPLALIPHTSITVVPDPPKPVPIYKKWWFWSLVGGTVAAGAVALGVGLSYRHPSLPSGINTYQPTY